MRLQKNACVRITPKSREKNKYLENNGVYFKQHQQLIGRSSTDVDFFKFKCSLSRVEKKADGDFEWCCLLMALDIVYR